MNCSVRADLPTPPLPTMITLWRASGGDPLLLSAAMIWSTGGLETRQVVGVPVRWAGQKNTSTQGNTSTWILFVHFPGPGRTRNAHKYPSVNFCLLFSYLFNRTSEDSTMLCAVRQTLPSSSSFTNKTSFVKPAKVTSPAPGLMTNHGQIIHKQTQSSNAVKKPALPKAAKG